MRHEQRPGTRARGGQAGLRPGVTAADHDDVVLAHCLKNNQLRVARDSSLWPRRLPPNLYYCQGFGQDSAFLYQA